MYQATTAPMVTSSPCAKLVSPVVPKISDRPTAQIAISRPKRRPSTNSWTARTPPPPAPRLPSVEAEVHRLPPALVDRDGPAVLAAERSTPSGRSLGVEGDDVLAGPGQLDLPAARPRRSRPRRPPRRRRCSTVICDALDRTAAAGLQGAGAPARPRPGRRRARTWPGPVAKSGDQQREHQETASARPPAATGRAARSGSRGPIVDRAAGHGCARASLDLPGRMS